MSTATASERIKTPDALCSLDGLQKRLTDMRIWAKTVKDHKIQAEVVQEFTLARPSDLSSFTPILSELCQRLDLSRPVVLQKHLTDLQQFSRVAFRASDFMEEISFDQFIIEIFPEEKKNTTFEYGAY